MAVSNTAPTPQEIEALLARADTEMTDALDVLASLTDSIQKHGNYSPESTITFIGQASSACTEAKNTAATALRALAEERERLAARSYTLAVAIMGGEDAPGYADSVDAETLVEQLREDRRRERDENDRLAAENARLREALARIERHAMRNYGHQTEKLADIAPMARAALNPTGDDK